MTESKEPQTTEELSDRVVKLSLSVVGLMKPNSAEEMEGVMRLARAVVQVQIDDYIQRVVSSSELAAKEVMEDK